MGKRLTKKAFIALGLSVFLLAVTAVSIALSDSARSAIGLNLGKTIVLDAGHGGFDGGAVGIDGVVEAQLNLQIALKVQAKFESAGWKVVQTRTADEGLGGDGKGTDKQKDMRARAQIIKDTKPDVMVSIHMNKYTSASVRGPQVFYQSGAAEGGAALAQCIQDRLNALIPEGWKKREVKSGDFYVLKAGEQPSVIVECGFISNPDEKAMLQDEQYQDRVAEAIFKGVLDSFTVETAKEIGR